jgi:hypothetical protein
VEVAISVKAAILCLLGISVGAAAPSSALLYTEAPQYDPQATLGGGERFPGGAVVKVLSGGTSRLLAPSLAVSADAALSPDARTVLIAAKEKTGQPWQIWEVPLAGGTPRQVTFGAEDSIRPFYAAEQKLVYARKTARGFQIEIAPLAGGSALRLTYLAGNFLPDGILRDGRVLFEAAFPAAFPVTPAAVRDLYTVYADGTGVETRRCDHGPDRHSAAEMASGDTDLPDRHGAGAVHFGARRTVGAGAAEGAVHGSGSGDRRRRVAGGVSRGRGGRVLDLPFPAAGGGAAGEGGRAERLPAGAGARPAGASVSPLQPGRSRGSQSAVPELLCFENGADAEGLGGGSAGVVDEPERGSGGDLGKAPVEADGSFYVQAPSETPLRFELLDRAGKTVAAEKGWFWARRGEQRVCVGCHAGPERAPENRGPAGALAYPEAGGHGETGRLGEGARHGSWGDIKVSQRRKANHPPHHLEKPYFAC